MGKVVGAETQRALEAQGSFRAFHGRLVKGDFRGTWVCGLEFVYEVRRHISRSRLKKQKTVHPARSRSRGDVDLGDWRSFADKKDLL